VAILKSEISLIMRILQNEKTYKLLLILNIVVSIGFFYAFMYDGDYDSYAYVGLADGILKGNYTYWNFIPNHIPDTFRNPGYPLFLALLKLFSDSYAFIKSIQLILFFLSIKMMLDLIDYYYQQTIVKNIFLLLLIPSTMYVTTHVAKVTPEALMIFLITLTFWLDTKISNEKWIKPILVGLLYGFLFQARPVFLFFPFIKFAWDWYSTRKQGFSYSKNLSLLAIYILTMLPYGFWNLKNNGVFKITSIEGGAGVFHNGYWMFKIPNHKETRYWGNTFFEEMIPFAEASDTVQNIKKYYEEWDKVEEQCKPYLTHTDSIMLDSAKLLKYKYLSKTYNSQYTLQRERLLRDNTIENIKNDLPYYIKTRIYTFCRLWITGMKLKDLEQGSTASKIKAAMPFILTFPIFLLSLIFIPIALYKHSDYFKSQMPVVLLIVYFGLIHIPFAIQARYTVPVRLLLLMLLAASLYKILFKKINEL
jgi:hypothetical protein